MLKTKFTISGKHTSKLSPGSTELVVLVCNKCGKETTTTWSNYVHRSNPGSRVTHCQKCAAAVSGKARRGKPNPATAARNRKRSGKKHPSWRGGRYIDLSGYALVSVRTGRNESGNGWANYRKEHILIVERKLGRKLRPGELVHHIDGDRQNNKVRNLWPSGSTGHRISHASLMNIGYELVRAGLVGFDRTNGIYVADLKLRELLEHLTAPRRRQSAAKLTRNGQKVQRLGRTVQTGRRAPRARSTAA